MSETASPRVIVEPAGNAIRVVLRGQVVAESHAAFVVHEVGLTPRYYFDTRDVKARLEAGTGEGVCPWKGKWKHLDLIVGEERIANAAWTYFETTPVCERVRDHVAFYAEKVDDIVIG